MALAAAPKPAAWGLPQVERGWSWRSRVARSAEGRDAHEGISVAVVGAGPVGLLTAVALARRGFRKVRVLDRLPEPPGPDAGVWGDPDRSYNLGIGGRGQRALAKFGALDRVDRWSQTVVGRKDWSGEGEPKVTINKRRYLTKVIARDRLSSCLYEELRESYPDVAVQFSTECTAVDFAAPKPRLKLRRCGAQTAEEGCDVEEEATQELEADFVVGADGVASAVRQALCEEGVKAGQSRFPDRRPIVYRVLAIPTADSDRTDLNYSARNDNVIVEALPNVEGSLLGVILFRPTDDRIQGLKTGAEAKAVFQELFPDWPTPLIPDDEWEAFAKRRTRELPQFAFAGPQLSLDGKCCLLGDAIHSVKPFFGLGLNSGFEDISVLDDCLQETGSHPGEALALYSRRRAPEAKCLVECQRRFDQPTDLRFALAFVLPLVLDSIFSKSLPKVFAPSILALFQDGELSFTAARWRKRRDRTLQVVLLLSGLCLTLLAARGAVGMVCHLLRRAAPHHALAWLHLHHELL